MASARDDRELPETRWTALAVVFVLLPALVVLWGLPHDTRDLWAWEIHPAMSPTFMGAGYGAGAYFFFRVFRARRWHTVSAGVLSAAVFAALELIVTIGHWNEFNKGDAEVLGAIAYYGWISVYIVSPFAIGWLWWRNQHTDPRQREPGDPLVPRTARLMATTVGIGAVAAGAVFLLSPSTAIEVWPWTLKPLAARVIAGFMIQVGVGALLLSRDERWSAWRLLLETFLLASVLLLIGAARQSGDFLESRPSTWIFLAGLIGLTGAVVALYVRMSRGTAQLPDPPRHPPESGTMSA